MKKQPQHKLKQQRKLKPRVVAQVVSPQMQQLLAKLKKPMKRK